MALNNYIIYLQKGDKIRVPEKLLPSGEQVSMLQNFEQGGKYFKKEPKHILKIQSTKPNPKEDGKSFENISNLIEKPIEIKKAFACSQN